MAKAGPRASAVSLDEGRRRLHLVAVLPSIEPYSEDGGAIATVAREVARSWLEIGHRVTVVAPRSEAPPYPAGDTATVMLAGGLPLQLARHLSDRLALRRADWPDHRAYLHGVRRVLASLDPPGDAVFVHNDPVAIRSLRAASPSARWVQWLHNAVTSQHGDTGALLLAHDAVVAVSRYVAGWTEASHGLPAGMVVVAHNGVDLERFRPSDAARDRSAPLRVVCHGRIDPNKGFHLVAAAVAALSARGIPIELTVAGPVQTFGLGAAATATYRDELLALVEVAGGRYLGRVPPDDVPALLLAADVACAPSLVPDPCPLVALEAMGSGCALLTSGRGGLAELVGDSGVTVDPDDLTTVVTALERLARDPDHLVERKAAARRRAERFPWGATAAGVLAAAFPGPRGTWSPGAVAV